MSDRLKLELCLLDKSFTIACSSEQVEKFEISSKYLSEKLENITSRSKVLSFDKALTMVSLNLVHELLQERAENSTNIENLEKLNKRLDGILKKLELDS